MADVSMASSANNASLTPPTREELISTLEEFINFLHLYPGDNDDDNARVIDPLQQDDVLDYLCTRMLPRAFQVARERNLFSDIDELPAEPDWIALRPFFKEVLALAPKITAAKSALTPNDTATPKYPAVPKRIETIDNQIAPENTTTSNNMPPSENNTIADNNVSPNTATNLEHDEVPKNVKQLYPSFQLWTSNPISFWQQQSRVDPSQLHIPGIYCLEWENFSPFKTLKHRFTCVVAYLSFNIDNQPLQHITKIKLRQHLQKFDISADQDSYFTDLIKTGRRCVEFCQQLQPDRPTVDYGPIFRLDIPDIIWKSQSTHSRKKFKIYLDKMRPQNISRWSEESGAQSAAKAIVAFILLDYEPSLYLAPNK